MGRSTASRPAARGRGVVPEYERIPGEKKSSRESRFLAAPHGAGGGPPVPARVQQAFEIERYLGSKRGCRSVSRQAFPPSLTKLFKRDLTNRLFSNTVQLFGLGTLKIRVAPTSPHRALCHEPTAPPFHRFRRSAAGSRSRDLGRAAREQSRCGVRRLRGRHQHRESCGISPGTPLRARQGPPPWCGGKLRGHTQYCPPAIPIGASASHHKFSDGGYRDRRRLTQPTTVSSLRLGGSVASPPHGPPFFYF